MSIPTLGRLERVDLRKAWISESGDFTPWLAAKENLKLLGDTIGLDLELEATERFVGPFRADILCRESVSKGWVLIENQLEKTDHTHLGQLFTYAASLKANTIVWIAERFTDEHRAALDWLNDISGDQLSVFGLEVELWRIDDSAMAPKLNVVCKPNNWIQQSPPLQLSSAGQLYLEYWQQFMEYVRSRSTIIKARKAFPQNVASFAIGRVGFELQSWLSLDRGALDASLAMTDSNAKSYFDQLLLDKEALENEIGAPLAWARLNDGIYSYVSWHGPVYQVTDRADWPEQHAWILQALERLHRVFAPRIRKLSSTFPSPLNDLGVPNSEGTQQ